MKSKARLCEEYENEITITRVVSTYFNPINCILNIFLSFRNLMNQYQSIFNQHNLR